MASPGGNRNRHISAHLIASVSYSLVKGRPERGAVGICRLGAERTGFDCGAFKAASAVLIQRIVDLQKVKI